MLPLEHPDRIQIAFDDHRLVANAGLLLPVTLAQHLGVLLQLNKNRHWREHDDVRRIHGGRLVGQRQARVGQKQHLDRRL